MHLFTIKYIFQPIFSIAEDLFLVRRFTKEGKVRIARAPVITSARRWQTLGVIHASLINVGFALPFALCPMRNSI